MTNTTTVHNSIVDSDIDFSFFRGVGGIDEELDAYSLADDGKE